MSEREQESAVGKRVQEIMERAVKLNVPLQVDVGIAQSWADC